MKLQENWKIVLETLSKTPHCQKIDIQMFFSIILDDVALTHLTFSADFTSAVEEKQIAEQRAEMARYKVEKAEQIKIANIIKAEGDAEAAKLVADVSF